MDRAGRVRAIVVGTAAVSGVAAVVAVFLVGRARPAAVTGARSASVVAVGTVTRSPSRTPPLIRPRPDTGPPDRDGPRARRPSPSPSSSGLATALTGAAGLASGHDLRAGLAVLDTRTGRTYGAGQVDGLFATASVVKVMIAAYLLLEHRLTGPTADLAYSMITRSDDDAANVLWGLAGGPALEPWIADHYGIANLGAPNTRADVWGNTHVTPRGLAQLYAKLMADPAVWPWLGNAMHHATAIAKDGTDQSFGIPAATSGAAVKQGWADGSADDRADAVVNTTGFVDHDRYVVVVLTEGRGNDGTSDDRGFNAGEAGVVTAMARMIVRALG